MPSGGIYADSERNKEVPVSSQPGDSLRRAAWLHRRALERAAHAYRGPSTDLDSRLAPLVGQNVGAVLVRLGESDLIGVGTGEDAFDFGMRQVHYIWGGAGCDVRLEVNPITRVVQSYEWSEMGYLCQRYAAQLDGKEGVL